MTKDGKKLLHRVWIQGESNMPQEYINNGILWCELLGDEWEMVMWDEQKAINEWRDYEAISQRCSHHAMRADIILARALRDYGGCATGTDTKPNNIENFKSHTDINDAIIVANPKGRSASNAISWFKYPNHPYIKCVCNHQLRDMKLLASDNVWAITGPRCYYEALEAHEWNITMVTDSKAFIKLYSDSKVRNPDAWIDAGYAGSWHK